MSEEFAVGLIKRLMGYQKLGDLELAPACLPTSIGSKHLVSKESELERFKPIGIAKPIGHRINLECLKIV